MKSCNVEMFGCCNNAIAANVWLGDIFYKNNNLERYCGDYWLWFGPSFRCIPQRKCWGMPLQYGLAGQSCTYNNVMADICKAYEKSVYHFNLERYCGDYWLRFGPAFRYIPNENVGGCRCNTV